MYLRSPALFARSCQEFYSLLVLIKTLPTDNPICPGLFPIKVKP